jgi:hypothetical protein
MAARELITAAMRDVPQVVLIDPPGSSLFNKVKRGVLYTREEAEGKRLRNPCDTITEGIGINRITANFSMAQVGPVALCCQSCLTPLLVYQSPMQPPSVLLVCRIYWERVVSKVCWGLQGRTTRQGCVGHLAVHSRKVQQMGRWNWHVCGCSSDCHFVLWTGLESS